MPHVLVAGRIHDAGVALLKSASAVTFTLIDEVSLESYAPLVGGADGLILRTQPLTAALVAEAPRLKIVSRHGVGYDAVDAEALSARGIPLAVVGDVNSRAVAEHTMMLMLAAARRVLLYDGVTRHGPWNRRNAFDAAELDGKTLLVFGFGRIGRRVADIAKAFGMRVIAHDGFVAEESMRAAGVSPAGNLDAALAEADFLTMHVPLVKGGSAIGGRELGLMKRSAIVVNTARGGLIDEVALDAALREGRLAGAALDVLADEPPKPGHPLLTNERVTFTPHTAGLTEECAQRMAVACVRNVLDCFDGKLDSKLVVNADRLAPS